MPAIPATMTISLGTYLRFELTHNYRPGATSVHWTLKQYNGHAEPMVMPLYGGIEILEPLVKHITQEINYYPPPEPAPLQNDELPLHNPVDVYNSQPGGYTNVDASRQQYKNGVDVNVRLENRHGISYEGTMFLRKCPPGAFHFVKPSHNNLNLSEFTTRFQPLFELFAYMVEDSIV